MEVLKILVDLTSLSVFKLLDIIQFSCSSINKWKLALEKLIITAGLDKQEVRYAGTNNWRISSF
jgi:hypothetical protein